MTVPPHDLAAERVVLGSISIANACIRQALELGLDRDDFYGPRHGDAYQAAVDLDAGGQAVDYISWPAKVPGLDSSTVVAWESEVTNTANLPTHAQKVMTCARQKALFRLCTDAAALARTGEPAEVLDLLNRGMGRISAQVEPVTAVDLFTDWQALWDSPHGEAEWLFPDVLARGRAHAIYAKHKAGKSLFVGWVAAQLATGQEPVAVVVLDYEMGPEDLFERLTDMGYGPDTDLRRLHYAQLPALPPLDTAAGADRLADVLASVQAQHQDHHLFVVVDTTARAVDGDENSADTIRAYYRHTGTMLKRLGCTSVRLDHAGKDVERGQRGSSAKGDDVDIVWRLTPAQGGINLKRELSRISWAPEAVSFAIGENPLRYTRTGDQYPPGTEEVAGLLDGLGLDESTSGNAAVTALREAGTPRRRALVLSALRYRKAER